MAIESFSTERYLWRVNSRRHEPPIRVWNGELTPGPGLAVWVLLGLGRFAGAPDAASRGGGGACDVQKGGCSGWDPPFTEVHGAWLVIGYAIGHSCRTSWRADLAVQTSRIVAEH